MRKHKPFCAFCILSHSLFYYVVSRLVTFGSIRWSHKNSGFSWSFLINIECVYHLLAVRSEKKRLRKPSKWLLEYTEEYDQIFAPKKKQKKVQEQVHKVCCKISANFHWSLGNCNFIFSVILYLHETIICLTGDLVFYS